MRPASRVDRPALARRAPPRHVPGRGRHAGPRLRAGLGRRQHEHLRVLPRRGASRHRARHHPLPARRPDPRPPLLAPGRDDPPRPRGRHALPAGPADQLAVPEPDPALHRQPPAHGRAAERVRVSGRGTPALAVLAAAGTAHVVHEYEAPEPGGGATGDRKRRRRDQPPRASPPDAGLRGRRRRRVRDDLRERRATRAPGGAGARRPRAPRRRDDGPDRPRALTGRRAGSRAAERTPRGRQPTVTWPTPPRTAMSTRFGFVSKSGDAQAAPSRVRGKRLVSTSVDPIAIVLVMRAATPAGTRKRICDAPPSALTRVTPVAGSVTRDCAAPVRRRRSVTRSPLRSSSLSEAPVSTSRRSGTSAVRPRRQSNGARLQSQLHEAGWGVVSRTRPGPAGVALTPPSKVPSTSRPLAAGPTSSFPAPNATRTSASAAPSRASASACGAAPPLRVPEDRARAPEPPGAGPTAWT